MWRQFPRSPLLIRPQIAAQKIMGSKNLGSHHGFFFAELKERANFHEMRVEMPNVGFHGERLCETARRRGVLRCDER